MSALWKVVALLKASFGVVVGLALLESTLPGQSSLNDIHIDSRRSASVLAVPATSIQAQTGSMLHIIKSDARLVLIPVSVTDPKQRLVTGLHEDNFEVFGGKKPQPIQNFSIEDSPVSIGIILDSSGSMGDKMKRVQEAVTQFCDEANPQDEYFMITFSDTPRLATDFTSSPDDLKKELLFTQAKGRTSLLDAIYMGLRKMKDAKYGKKALLIISDGGDNHSSFMEREVKSAAKESDVMIYSIGTFDSYVSTVEESRGPELLSEIAEPTGGRAFTLDNPREMPAVARHIAMELRTQYVLAYRPENMPHDGKWHKIKVRLRLPRKLSLLRAHAKAGYYVSAE
jgi:Ca-activated chloride channel family protein